MGLDMYLYKAPKVDSIKELEKLEIRLSKAFYKEKLHTELVKVQKKLKLKNPINYTEDSFWLSSVKSEKEFLEINKEFHCPKIKLQSEVAYWRKFNALHNWFVQNIQNGEDDCGSYIVDIDKLKELLYKLAKINKKNAKKILPTASGFFFGGTEYDEYYFEEIKNLCTTIMALVESINPEEEMLIYRSSW